MRALPEPKLSRAVRGEVLGPNDPVPDAVRCPFVAEVYENVADMTFRVRLGKGGSSGSWRIDAQALYNLDIVNRSDMEAIVEQLFERRQVYYRGERM